MNFTTDPFQIPEDQQTPLVKWLLEIIRDNKQLIETQAKKIEELKIKVEVLDDELKKLKKLPPKPDIKKSTLNENPEDKKKGTDTKRPGSDKESKKLDFEVHEERIIQPELIPLDAKFNGYREYDVQDLVIENRNIRFKLAEYIDNQGNTITGQLPVGYTGHFGPKLMAFIIYQHNQCRVTQNLILEQLREIGINISTGQINRILTENHSNFHEEQLEVLKAGLEVSTFVHTDDTGARCQGKNGYCNVIGNDLFTHFTSSDNKSRANFLQILAQGNISYVLDEYAQAYLLQHDLPKVQIDKFNFNEKEIFTSEVDWKEYLIKMEVTTKQSQHILTDAALLAGAIHNGLSPNLIILSDGAPQFAILIHAMCWVHAERPIRRLYGYTELQKIEIEEVQTLLWLYYRELKKWRENPNPLKKEVLLNKFDEIFSKNYQNHRLLNEALQNIFSNKAELLRVLDFPFVPLHTNAAEGDIREFVTKRKVSGGTRSQDGKKSRDTFLSLKKTCRKLGVSFWRYLNSRLKCDLVVPRLESILRLKAAPS